LNAELGKPVNQFIPMIFILRKYSLLLLPFTLFVCRANAQNSPEEIKLSHYRPQSIFKIPETKIVKAKFPVIDIHSHDYSKTDADVDQRVKNMDAAGIQKTIILSYQTGAAFDSLVKKYSRYPNRFEVWCGFDYTGFNTPGWSQRAVKELERCHKMGAKGVGELGDKGEGLYYSKPSPALGMHIDDPRMKPLLEKCAELHMPVSVHVADPMWMYEPMDSTNDGLMNAYTWRIDLTKKGILNHAQLIQTLENAVRENPKTTFIACHLANCVYDLSILGKLFDKYRNLYADIGARFGETATIPRNVSAFYTKYQDRILYGTDLGYDVPMYRNTFRILQTLDEHFYDGYNYHWPLYGLGLNDKVLKKLYRENALRIMDAK